jgi:hypothetical protein
VEIRVQDWLGVIKESGVHNGLMVHKLISLCTLKLSIQQQNLPKKYTKFMKKQNYWGWFIGLYSNGGVSATSLQEK